MPLDPNAILAATFFYTPVDGGPGHQCRVDWKHGMFAADCSCKWRGPYRQKLAEAEKDMDQHIALIGV